MEGLMQGTIIDYASDGSAVAKTPEGVIYFLDQGLIDEKVTFVELGKKKGVRRGETKAIIKASKYRLSPPCPYAPVCGGCDFQHLAYEAQAVWKRNRVSRELTNKLGQQVKVEETFMPQTTTHYRNHMQWHVKNGEIGLYRKGTNELVPIKSCLMQKEQGNLILDYLLNEGKDLLKHPDLYMVGIRTNELGEAAVIFMTRKKLQWEIQGALEGLKALHVINVIHNINPKGYDHYGKTNKVLYQSKPWRELVGGREFHYSPTGFFQVNQEAQAHIVKRLNELLQDYHSMPLIELYCGAGVLGLSLVTFDRVRGIEVSSEAIDFARRNAKAKKGDHLFMAGKAPGHSLHLLQPRHPGKRFRSIK